MDAGCWIIIVLIVVAILVVIKLGGKPPRPRGGGAGRETVGGIDLPTWVAMEENLDDE